VKVLVDLTTLVSAGPRVGASAGTFEGVARHRVGAWIVTGFTCVSERASGLRWRRRASGFARRCARAGGKGLRVGSELRGPQCDTPNEEDDTRSDVHLQGYSRGAHERCGTCRWAAALLAIAQGFDGAWPPANPPRSCRGFIGSPQRETAVPDQLARFVGGPVHGSGHGWQWVLGYSRGLSRVLWDGRGGSGESCSRIAGRCGPRRHLRSSRYTIGRFAKRPGEM